MKKEHIILGSNLTDYDLNRIAPPEDIIFLDIETTGLVSYNSFIYMIGMAYYSNDNYHYECIFAEDASEEEELLDSFLRVFTGHTMIIHYNGNTFDLPFIEDRAKAFGKSIVFNRYDGIDLYRRISPFKHMLGLSNCKQKTIESFLDVGRDDEYTGGELIHVYRKYTETKDEELYKLLYTHNRDDVIGLIKILPMLSYLDLYNDPVTVKSVKINTYRDAMEALKKELLIEFSINSPLPGPLSSSSEGCYVSIKGDNGLLKIPIYHEELKYFFENYKDYYYLPEEDMAVHKSVSIYVDKAFRKQATAATCYCRKVGDYLPQWDYIFTPFFKREYDSTQLFFELTDEVKKSREAFCDYVSHILVRMAK